SHSVMVASFGVGFGMTVLFGRSGDWVSYEMGPCCPTPRELAILRWRPMWSVPLAKCRGCAYFAARLRRLPRFDPTRPSMASNAPVPRPGILDISPYAPGESAVPG